MSTPDWTKPPWEEDSGFGNPIPQPLPLPPRHADDSTEPSIVPFDEVEPPPGVEATDPPVTDNASPEEPKHLEWPPNSVVPQFGKEHEQAMKIWRRNRPGKKDPAYLDSPPTPSAEEIEYLQREKEERLQEAERQAFAKRRDQARQAVIDRNQRCDGGIILGVGEIGGSGTTVALTFAAAKLRERTSENVGFLDCNYAQGHGSGRLGVRTLRLQELADYRDIYRGSRRALEGAAHMHPVLGVRCVASSPRMLDNKEMYTRTDVRECVEIFASWHKYSFIDSPNEFTSPIGLELIRMADVIVATANFRKQESLKLVWYMLRALQGQAPEKMSKVIVFITGYPTDRQAEEFRGYLQHLEEIGGQLVPIKDDEHDYRDLPIQGIPHDDHILTDQVYPLGNLQSYTDVHIEESVLAVLNKLPDAVEMTPQSAQRLRAQMRERASDHLPALTAQEASQWPALSGANGSNPLLPPGFTPTQLS